MHSIDFSHEITPRNVILNKKIFFRKMRFVFISFGKKLEKVKSKREKSNSADFRPFLTALDVFEKYTHLWNDIMSELLIWIDGTTPLSPAHIPAVTGCVGSTDKAQSKTWGKSCSSAAFWVALKVLPGSFHKSHPKTRASLA